MTPEVKIIHQLSQNKIFEISSKSEGDLKAWVANGQYLMENPLVPNSQKRANEFKLRFQDSDSIYIALTYDCNRLVKLKNYLKVLLGPQSKCIIQHFLLHMRY